MVRLSSVATVKSPDWCVPMSLGRASAAGGGGADAAVGERGAAVHDAGVDGVAERDLDDRRDRICNRRPNRGGRADLCAVKAVGHVEGIVEEEIGAAGCGTPR